MNHDSKQILFLSSISLMSQMMISMINLSLVYYLRDVFQFSPSLIAVSVSTFSISYVIFCILVEKPSNNFSPRHLIFMSLLGMAISIFLFLNSKSFVLIIISLILYGAFMALLWPPMETWYSRGREKIELTKAISYFNLSWELGMSIAPIFCGLLTQINVSLPIVVGIVFFLLLSVNVLLITNRVPYLKAVESEKQFIKQNLLKDESTPLRFLSWVAIILGYFFLGMLLNIFPLYGREVLLINETKIGILLWSRGIISCIAFYYLGKTVFWHFKRSLIIIGQVLLAILSYSSSYITSYNYWFIMFILFGFIFSLIYMQSIFHGVSGAINRSRRMMIHEVLLTAGMVLGSIFGGYIYEKVDFRTVMVDFSIFMILVILIEILFYIIYVNVKQKKKK
ncbi:MAG: MFS transporter [Sphaerochaetaceae bacterium]|nr:MFS transporter [Sphaerochaetaceae bacterium]MDC7236380.1 MFS transporter [Sphaerochaetaceae bacterium]MDC7242717.1 MFS transporter [Sphaerochaetaceae bacterium]